jgi:TolA-binding protein
LLIDAGKLTGTLSPSQENPVPGDLAWLLVPFNLDEWQLHETALGAGIGTSSASGAPVSNDYAQGEGSRCSNAKDGLETFQKAVNAAAALPKEEALILIAARGALAPDCNSTTHPDWNAPQGIHSALGREFALYIAATNAFYAGDFPAALNNFNSLKKSANPWLKETSRYMVGRTLLNSAQSQAFGEWGDLKLDHVNNDNLKDAEDAFNSYLHDFPRGLYAVSARGLLRRVYWLGGDQTRLADAFDRALADSDKGANNVSLLDLVQEADTKLLTSAKIDQIKSPQLLAIIDLMRMRSEGGPSGSHADYASLTLADIEAQKDRAIQVSACRLPSIC